MIRTTDPHGVEKLHNAAGRHPARTRSWPTSVARGNGLRTTGLARAGTRVLPVTRCVARVRRELRSALGDRVGALVESRGVLTDGARGAGQLDRDTCGLDAGEPRPMRALAPGSRPKDEWVSLGLVAGVDPDGLEPGVLLNRLGAVLDA